MSTFARDMRIIQDRPNMTLRQLSEKHGLSLSQISRICKAYDAEHNRRHPCNNDEWLRTRIAAGKTKREMAMEAGVPLGTIHHWVRRMQGKIKRYNYVAPTTPPPLWDSYTWLNEFYNTREFGLTAISRLVGRSPSYIASRLRSHGISVRSHKEAMAKKRSRPPLDWCVEYYIKKAWSVGRCAKACGLTWATFLETLRDYGIATRTASEQHEGVLNEFYGKRHPEEICLSCAEIGSRAGREYWTTGDVEAKRELASVLSKAAWSDAERRSAASCRIAELCKAGKCNVKATPYLTKNGECLLLHGSWESAIAGFLDECEAVANWKYQEVIIPYLIDEDVHNFVVDFVVEWRDGLVSLIESKNPHLLAQEKEQAKIEAAKEFCSDKGWSFVLVASKEEVKKILARPPHRLSWTGSRYNAYRAYLKDSELSKEAMSHEIVAKVSPWPGLRYTDEELHADLGRLWSERLAGYLTEQGLRSTTSNSGGMPGRRIMTHFQPHFWQTPVGKGEPIAAAFSDKHLLRRCVWKSMSEQESLSLERLIREINYAASRFRKTSHFAPGFARAITRYFGLSGRWFDPCCGWGGRLIGAFLESLDYCGFELSPLSHKGLLDIAGFLDAHPDIRCGSCLDEEWPDHDFLFTSPPFFNIERYVGGQQPWQTCKTREQWQEAFVKPFLGRITKTSVLYLDEKTKNDFELLRKFDKVVPVANRRHARRKDGNEYLCLYS